MKKILIIESSPREGSITRKLTQQTEARLKQQYPDAQFVERDLVATGIPHLSSETLQAFMTPAEGQDSGLQSAIALSNQLTEELLAADIIVIAAPMWNFGVPSILKAWIDHVCRAGKTFSYSENGPVGLLARKEAVLLIASGGVYSAGPMQAYDFTEPYLRTVLGFIGVQAIQTVRAEGLAIPTMTVEAIDTAEKAVAALAL